MPAESRHQSRAATETGRHSLRIYFRCANAYQVALRHKSEGVYTARCPSCGKVMRFRVGKGGTEQRFFELSC